MIVGLKLTARRTISASRWRYGLAIGAMVSIALWNKPNNLLLLKHFINFQNDRSLPVPAVFPAR